MMSRWRLREQVLDGRWDLPPLPARPMLLSPPTDDGDDHDDKGEGRRDEIGGGGRRQGPRAM